MHEKPLDREVREVLVKAMGNETSRLGSVMCAARALGYDSLATWHYARDSDEMANIAISYGIKRYRIAVTNSQERPFEIIELHPTREQLARELENYYDFFHPTLAVTMCQDEAFFGKHGGAHVFVLPCLFGVARCQENAPTLVESWLRHEGRHVQDYHNGIDLGGGLGVRDAYQYSILHILGGMEPMMELRAYGDTLLFQHGAIGKRHSSDFEGYKKAFGACRRFLAGNRNSVVGDPGANDIIARQIELHQQDPVLGQLIR